jgi:hypothetical protein
MSEHVFLQAFSMLLGTIAFVASAWVVRRYLELRQERRVPIALEGLQERLERIENTVDSTAIEVERISEGNRFVAKLLAERAGEEPAESLPKRVTTPH